jgi:hypothetical protein
MKKTIGHTDEALELVPATALLGGTAMYLLAHVGFRYRHIGTLSKQRLLTAVVTVALIPVAVELPALATLALLAVVLSALVAYETIRFAERRDEIRHQLDQPGGAA